MQYVKITFLLLCSLAFCFLQAQERVSVSVDFGNNLSELPWNNLTLPRTGALTNLLDSRGLPSDLNIRVSDAFNGINNSGTTNPDPSLDLPSTATADSFFGNLTLFGDATEPTAAVTISNMDVKRSYDLSLFASRLASDNRETEYIIESATTDTAYLSVSDNMDTAITFQNLRPAADGTITIRCTAGPNNDNEFNFYYLGALVLQFEAEPVEVDPTLALVFPQGGEFWQSSQRPEIRWQSQGIGIVDLQYSIDDGLSWIEIETVNALAQSYEWAPPMINNTSVKVRIVGEELMDESEDFFEISTTDTSDCHIVILGSSTAAGTGPSTLDSAWVWRYRDFMFQNDTRKRVTNLARGGFTTYNIIPTASQIPEGVNQTIDPARNVTMARSLNPDAVIINLPSNDAANGFSVATQLTNYSLMTDSLDVDSIVYWIATPQPRNNFNTAQKQIQLDLRDSTFAIFGDFAIDFYNGFQTAENDLDPAFDSGDGVHMNDAAHRELFLRVVGATETAAEDCFFFEPQVDPCAEFVNDNTELNILNNVLCFGEQNGSAIAFAQGGTLPYTYLWSNGETEETAINLPPGQSFVTVSDANDCEAVFDFMINEPTEIILVANATDATSTISNDGIANALATGGTSPFTYLWSNEQTDAEITNLSPGEYTVTVTDANDCSATAMVIVGAVSNCETLSADYSITPVSCFGGTDGSIIVEPSGGTAPYLIEANTSTLTGLMASTYEITITDDAGCQLINQVELPSPTELIANHTVVEGESDGLFDVTVDAAGGTPPYQYAWNDGASTPSNVGLIVGNYDVTITDDNGCTAVLAFEIDETTSTLDNLDMISSFVMSPNPTNGQFFLDVTFSQPTTVHVVAYDIVGQNILERTYTGANIHEKINLNNQPSGTYYVRLYNETGQVSKKLIKVD